MILSEGDELLHRRHDSVLDPWRGFVKRKDLVEEDLLPCSEEGEVDSHEGSRKH